MTHFSRSLAHRPVTTFAIILIALCLGAPGLSLVQAQRRGDGGDDEPPFKEYRGVQIGMPADDVRKKLGSPADKGSEQDFYVFGEKETIQVLYDKAGKVTTISVDFMAGANGTLTPRQVFGGEIEPKADGSVYKMVRYPKAGCWLSYNRTAGDRPLVTVTITKIE